MGEYLAQVYVVAFSLLVPLLGVVTRTTRARILSGAHDSASWGLGFANGVVLFAMVGFIVLAGIEVFGG